jgi:hypothetical protein
MPHLGELSGEEFPKQGPNADVRIKVSVLTNLCTARGVVSEARVVKGARHELRQRNGTFTLDLVNELYVQASHSGKAIEEGQ